MKREYITPESGVRTTNPVSIICLSTDTIPVTNKTEGNEEIVPPPSNAQDSWY